MEPELHQQPPKAGATGDAAVPVVVVSDSPHAAEAPVASRSDSLAHAHAALQSNHTRLWVIGAITIVALAAAGFFGIPFVSRALNTVSTDDAYVNGHVTFVAPRVSGQVVEVRVDDNYKVRQGETIVQLDKRPFEIIVEAKRAARDVAKANVTVAQDQVRATIGQTRANRFKLQHAIEDVKNQVAILRANVAALETAKAKLARAESDYQRAQKIHDTNPGAISGEDLDKFKEAYRVGEAQVTLALQQVYQIRVSLGLPEQPEHGDNLAEVPPDLDQTFSTVRQALGELMQSAAPLGIVSSSYDIKPNDQIAEFYKRDPTGNLDKIYAKIIEDSPDIKLAQAKLAEAQSDLDQAELNLSYCDVKAEIAGVVTRRDVNPGNNVIAGQSLMAIRSLTELWVDANFKETQLANLKIGQPVDLDVDMYGSRQVFKGRISGFTMGTGSTLALLPAENATGNFVKVVQRLTVRINLEGYDSKSKTPLFIGLSVTPYVRINEPATGKDAGEFLQREAKAGESGKQSIPEKQAKPENPTKPEKQP